MLTVERTNLVSFILESTSIPTRRCSVEYTHVANMEVSVQEYSHVVHGQRSLRDE
jgi:hypothetical protein